MLQSVLIPTDFSENAVSACKYAFAIAEKFDSKIYIVHAYTPFHSGFQSEDANENDKLQAEADAQQEMINFLQKVEIEPQAPIKYGFFQGSLVDAIQHWIKTESIDIIIMGTNGISGPTHKLMGSETFKVARSCYAPVIVVPIAIENFRLDQIAFFTNYNEGDVEALKKLETLFGASESTYRLIHIHESDDRPSNEDLKMLQEWASLLGRKAGINNLAWELVHDEESAISVNNIAARNNTDLLVMTVEHESFFERLFDQNLTKEVLQQPKTPVLLIRSFHTDESS